MFPNQYRLNFLRLEYGSHVLELESSVPKVVVIENSLKGTPESGTSKCNTGDVRIARKDDKYCFQAKAEGNLDVTVFSPKPTPCLRTSFSPKQSPSGSIINRRNSKGESPLHLAAIKVNVLFRDKLNANCLKCLLI